MIAIIICEWWGCFINFFWWRPPVLLRPDISLWSWYNNMQECSEKQWRRKTIYITQFKANACRADQTKTVALHVSKTRILTSYIRVFGLFGFGDSQTWNQFWEITKCVSPVGWRFLKRLIISPSYMYIFHEIDGRTMAHNQQRTTWRRQNNTTINNDGCHIHIRRLWLHYVGAANVENAVYWASFVSKYWTACKHDADVDADTQRLKTQQKRPTMALQRTWSIQDSCKVI